MLSGAGVQMHAINVQKNNRRLLKQKKEGVFDPIGKNKFINAPKIKFKVPSGFYESLKNIKRERKLKLRNIKNLMVLAVFALTICVTLGFYYFIG